MSAFFNKPEKRSMYISFRVPPTEHALVTALGEIQEVSASGIMRVALDLYLESLSSKVLAEANRRAQLASSGGKTSPDAGSSKRPAGSTAKVKAMSKKRSQKRTDRTQ